MTLPRLAGHLRPKRKGEPAGLPPGFVALPEQGDNLVFGGFWADPVGARTSAFQHDEPGIGRNGRWAAGPPGAWCAVPWFMLVPASAKGGLIVQRYLSAVQLQAADADAEATFVAATRAAMRGNKTAGMQGDLFRSGGQQEGLA